MVAVLVVLTFIALIAINYYLVRDRAPAPVTEAASRVLPKRAITKPAVPAGVYLQPSWTWSRPDDDHLYVGVSPLLVEIVGTPLSLDCRRHGEYVRRGEPLVHLGRGQRRLAVPSPVSGTVELVNYPSLAAADAYDATHTRGASWLYRIRPDEPAAARAGWLSGDAALSWSRRAYRDLREFVQGQVTDRELGIMMADGGELPAGILGEMNDDVWAGVQERIDEAARAQETTT